MIRNNIRNLDIYFFLSDMFYKNNQSTERLSKIGKDISIYHLILFHGDEGLCIN